ncbi:MAG: MBL fold metallo-hydrolase [Myxococcaceae bacterium]
MAVELKKQGLHLTGTPLWLDAQRKTELSFVSHAHSDHIGRHERVIATAATLKFMAHRLGKLPPASLPVPYNRTFELGPLVLELLPAGHILGSAQLRVIRKDGKRIVYTGDVNPASSLTAEPLQVAECDTLIIESTFGHPRYAFAPRSRTLSEIEQWCRGNLQRGVTPVLLGYPLGKSQEAIKFLGAAGLKIRAHRSVFAICEIYRELGVELNVELFDGELGEGEVAFFPPNHSRGSAIAKMQRRQVAVLTGWAVDPGAERRYGADIAFALSDHADFPSLVKYVKATGASEVITHHGFAKELAKALVEEGIDARPLGIRQQLDLFNTPAAKSA